MKKRVFGIVLLSLGIITALLARFIGFELDISYIVISVIGIFLFAYGSIQKKQPVNTGSDSGHSGDVT